MGAGARVVETFVPTQSSLPATPFSLEICPQPEIPLSLPSSAGIGGGLQPITCKYRVQKPRPLSLGWYHFEVPLMLQSSHLGQDETGLLLNLPLCSPSPQCYPYRLLLRALPQQIICTKILLWALLPSNLN